MRCTYSLCYSGDTKLTMRTCQLIYNNGKVISYDINEIWLCNTCGNVFTPSVKKCTPLLMRYKTPPRPMTKRKPRRITKKEIIKELFAQ